ncbi:MAG: hypothetical protein ACLSA2_08020 [Candidatus Gastranaerophilaceae bacterium]
MNKVKLTSLITFIMFAGILTPVFADETLYEEAKSIVDAPKWTDFCEAGYEKAEVNRNRDVLNVFSFVKAENKTDLLGREAKVLKRFELLFRSWRT